LPDAAGGLSRLEQALAALQRVAGAPLRVWRSDGRRLKRVAGPSAPDWVPAVNGGAGRRVQTPEGPAWLEPIAGAPGVWLEIREPGSARSGPHALAQVVAAILGAEKETIQVAAELSERYEEIDLIYTISEILGHTIRLDEAAQRIVGEVANVVGARRASLLVYDPERKVLRIAAARGMDPAQVEPIEIDEECSVAAQAFREMKILSYDPATPGAKNPGCPDGRDYRGRAFLCVPVMYAAPGGPPRAIGVINLTDRVGEDAFTAGDRKLVAAIANQIGAAIENSRLAAHEQGRQRVQRELELAHDLQLKLLPAPTVLTGLADVAVRCRPAESVGGDFYNLLRLHGDRVGVMIGDVSSHGFGAALIMALAMAAAGIHAEVAEAPADVLARLEESLADELRETEMYFTLFYGVLDAKAGRLTYASAGHGYAFHVAGDTGTATRLETTRTPLGFGGGSARGEDRTLPWHAGRDILCLFTDGLVEAEGNGGERFGDSRVVGHVVGLRDRPMEEILTAIYAGLAAFTGGAGASDDRTVVLLKA